MKLRIKAFIIFAILSIQLTAQDFDKNYFRSPVNIPIRLAGNFGEIRPNHFHSGIDIKAPYSGVKLYAAADGYISRIRKSSGGYGNALYINHPNGLMTVYGHLQKFNKKLEEYAEKTQYELNTFEFTMYPDSNEFVVNFQCPKSQSHTKVISGYLPLIYSGSNMLIREETAIPR